MSYCRKLNSTSETKLLEKVIKTKRIVRKQSMRHTQNYIQFCTQYLLFIGTTGYLLNVFFSLTIWTNIYPWGADLVALDSSFHKIGNNVAQCNGPYSCYESACNMSNRLDIGFVAFGCAHNKTNKLGFIGLREHYENATCSTSLDAIVAETGKSTLLNIVRQLFVIGAGLEFVSLVALIIRFFWYHFDCIPYKVINISWNILFCLTFLGAPICLTTIAILLLTTYEKLNNVQGDSIPLSLFNTAVVSVVILLATLFINVVQILLSLSHKEEDDLKSLIYYPSDEEKVPSGFH